MATSKTYTVAGMTCGHCVKAVSDEVAAIGGVTSVVIDLESGSVTVESDAPIDDATIAAAVDEAGYELVP